MLHLLINPCKAIIASCGGNDEIRILPFLDAEVIASNPKPFLGYSDNTIFICFCGI